MPLIYVVLVLLITGVILWLINTYVPMAGSIKTILNAVVVIAVCVWVLQAFGLWTAGSELPDSVALNVQTLRALRLTRR